MHLCNCYTQPNISDEHLLTVAENQMRELFVLLTQTGCQAQRSSGLKHSQAELCENERECGGVFIRPITAAGRGIGPRWRRFGHERHRVSRPPSVLNVVSLERDAEFWPGTSSVHTSPGRSGGGGGENTHLSLGKWADLLLFLREPFNTKHHHFTAIYPSVSPTLSEPNGNE